VASLVAPFPFFLFSGVTAQMYFAIVVQGDKCDRCDVIHIE
jgi:hypothetical protein